MSSQETQFIENLKQHNSRIESLIDDENINEVLEERQRFATENNFPTVPDDGEKRYDVICKDGEDWKYIHQLLSEDNTTEENIPTHCCECCNDHVVTECMGTYLLTDDEVELLKQHEKVLAVNIDKGYYSGTFVNNNFPKIRGRYSNKVKFQRDLDTSGQGGTNPSSSHLSQSGYNILRGTSKLNPWYGISPSTVLESRVSQTGTGKDIDIVVLDSMMWYGHIEFVSTGVGEPDDFIPGNALDPNGKCGVLDIFWDAPYYIDPEFFDADQANRTEIRWDGTRVPKVEVAMDWWSGTSTSERSARFAFGGADYFGSISLGSYQFFIHTRDGFQGNLSADPTLDSDFHGTSCASQVYGKTHGWAYNANKWHMPFLANGGIPDSQKFFEALKVFHLYKPNRSSDGTKNPTITSNSWGKGAYLDNATHYFWRTPGDGTAGTGSKGTLTKNTGDSIYSNGSPYISSPNYLSTWWYGNSIEPYLLTTNSESTSIKSMMDAGIIVVAAAGNNGQQCVGSTHPNWNNYLGNTASTTQSQSETLGSSSSPLYTNRPSFPCCAGEYTDNDASSSTYGEQVFPAIMVSALDDNGKSNTQESKTDYSYYGELITCYAPGENTLSASTRTSLGQVGSSDTYVYDRNDSTYTIGATTSRNCYNVTFSGSSSACPVACGIIATKLEYNRTWTWKDIKSWISDSVGVLSPSEFYEGPSEPSTHNDSNWGDSYALYGASRSIIWNALSVGDPSLTSGLKLRGNINFNSNRVPEYEITNLPSNVDEGQSISPIIGATPAWKNLITNDSYRVYWELSGVGIASTDFENVSADGNPDTGTTLTGYVDTNVPSGAKQFSIGIRSDTHTDDPDGAIVDASENATLSIYRDSARTTLLDSKTFAINDTSVSDNYEVLLVAGGARGGNTSGAVTYISWGAAGGGGAGGVRHLSLQSLFGNGAGQYTNVYFEIGDGGGVVAGQSNGGPTKMYDGTSNSGTLLYQVEGGGVGAYNNGRVVNTNGDDVSAIDGGDAPANGGSGGGGNSHCDSGNTLGGSAGLYGNDGGGVSDRGGGGNGGGAGGAAPTRTASTSRGGYGYDLTNFFSELSTDGPDGDGRIAGGGGGGHTVSQNGVYQYGFGPAGTGEAGGGDGGNSTDGGNAAANSGSGGGGAGGSKGSQGGNGGSGIVYVKYSSTVQLLEWTGTASDHTVTSYNVNTGSGINPVWIHKILGDGYLSVI